MRPFRFHIPFFGSPSRLSSGASSSSPSPPSTPSPTRPPFRPAGIAQPPKSGTSLETKSKVSSSPARVKTNAAAMASAASSSASQSLSPGTVRRTKQKQSNKSESEEPKTDVEEKPLRDSETKTKEAANINSVIQKPSAAGPEEHAKRKEVEAAAQEESKKTVEQKPAVQERRKVLPKSSEEKSSVLESKANEQKEHTEAAQEQQKRKETEKRALLETKRALQVSREDATRSIAAASESTKGLRDPPETKTQNRTEIHGKSRDTIGEGSPMSKKIKEDVRDGISKLNLGGNNGEEKSVRVVTLAGENKGATMQIASDKNTKDGEIKIRRGYRTNPDESPNSTATDNEEGGRRSKNPKYNEENASITAYANNNSQGINNSIVFESSVKENDPGIHMSFRFEESKVKEIVNPPESVDEKKWETTVEKLTKAPTVRRRCLRGLFAESSDSEPENPLKPRRHGCRFTCKDKDKESTF